MIAHDKFRSYKIQNGCQSAISFFFLIISEILHDSLHDASSYFP